MSPTTATPTWTHHANGMLSLTRRSPDGAPAKVLVAELDFCTQPDCGCREVGLRCVEVEETVWLGGIEHELRRQLDEQVAVAASLDLDLGTVTPDNYGGRTPLSTDWAAFAQEAVDGQLLDRLHHEWRHAKGEKPQKPDFTVVNAEPDLMVGWWETQLHVREDLYQLEDTVYRAEELYCPEPGCSCGEVVIDFVKGEEADEDDPEALGGIRMRAADRQVIERLPVKGKEALVERLWAAFQRRHRDPERLVRHQKELLTALAEDRAARAAAPRKPRAGRNEPCPCGSGEKYKRCCLDKDGAAQK